MPGSAGDTGYPIVDAGMRELWHTGWMHNRVRMIVASFLVKDLLIPWQEGARWFWDTLVDADLANNTAGLAVDGRLRCRRRALLPHLQPGEPGREVRSGRRTTSAAGCRSWTGCRASGFTSPGRLPLVVLADAGVELGSTYPLPIVDHREARSRRWKLSNESRIRRCDCGSPDVLMSQAT